LRYVPLLLLILLTSPVTYAELPRHTPNFPEGIDLGPLQTALESLLADLAANLSNKVVDYQDILNELVNRGVLNPEEAGELSKIASIPPSELAGPNIPPEVVKSLTSGNLSLEELEDLAKLLVELRRSGVLDPYSFLALSRLLLGVAKSMGVALPKNFSTEVLRTISEVVNTLGTQRQKPQLPAGGEPWAPPSLPKLSAQLPSIPSIGVVTISPDSLVTFLAVLASLAILTAVVFVVRTERIRSTLRSLLPKLPRGPGGVPGNDVISIYWSSVRIVERVAKTPRAEYVTHREYLRDVISREPGVRDVENFIASFKELTELYELRRFGFVAEDKVVGRVRDAYIRLVRSIG